MNQKYTQPLGILEKEKFQNDVQLFLSELDSTKNYIVKSNNLIRKTKFELSSKEQKIVLALIQQIRPDDDELYPVAFTIKNLCELTGLTTGGNNYIHFKEAIQHLANRSMWISYFNENGKAFATLARWIDDPVINPETNEIYLKLNDKLKTDLLNLSQNYTKYNFQYILPMKGMYSVRLYEILKSYAFRITKTEKKIKLNLEILREVLSDAESIKSGKGTLYERFADFKRFVIESAIKEINEFSDMIVSVEYIKEKRRVTDVVFEINMKTKFSKLTTGKKVMDTLNRKDTKNFNNVYGRQLSFEEYNKSRMIGEKIISSSSFNMVEEIENKTRQLLIEDNNDK